MAHAFYPYEFDSFGGDIHFDEDEAWVHDKEQTNSGTDFFTVAVSIVHFLQGVRFKIYQFLQTFNFDVVDYFS